MEKFDFYTRYGAQVNAETIRQFWLVRGYNGVQVEHYEIPMHAGMWSVRSNIVNGWPPRG